MRGQRLTTDRHAVLRDVAHALDAAAVKVTSTSRHLQIENRALDFTRNQRWCKNSQILREVAARSQCRGDRSGGAGPDAQTTKFQMRLQTPQANQDRSAPQCPSFFARRRSPNFGRPKPWLAPDKSQLWTLQKKSIPMSFAPLAQRFARSLRIAVSSPPLAHS
jgi:hypothetical protein